MPRSTPLVLVFAFQFLCQFFAAAQALPKASASDLGFSAERLGHIAKVLKEDAEKGMTPGSVLMIVRHGKVAYFESQAF